MVRKSNNKLAYIQAVGDAVQRYQETTAVFDDIAGKFLGLNPTDLKCLGIIFQRGRVSASEIASAAFLTRGATTTALDRIEAAGYAIRVRSTDDRRAVLLELTDEGKTRIFNLWGPLISKGEKLLSQFDLREIQTILKFLTESISIQSEQIRLLHVISQTRQKK